MFGWWEGDASGNSRTVTIVMDSDKSVKANFLKSVEKETFNLDTTVVQGKGTVTPSSGEFEKGETVTLKAEPAEGYQFQKWGGDASGQENPTTITMNSNRWVKAFFKRIGPEQVTLTLKTSPPEGGSITLTQSRQVSVDKGTVVSLQAFSNSNYVFDHWSGDVSGTSKSIRFTANEDSTIIANFEEVKGITDILKENVSLITMAIGGVMVLGGVAVIGRSRFE